MEEEKAGRQNKRDLTPTTFRSPRPDLASPLPSIHLFLLNQQLSAPELFITVTEPRLSVQVRTCLTGIQQETAKLQKISDLIKTDKLMQGPKQDSRAPARRAPNPERGSLFATHHLRNWAPFTRDGCQLDHCVRRFLRSSS